MTMTLDDTHLCLSGRRCADTVDGHARETAAPGTLCPRCLARSTSRVERLPEQFLRLHALIGERHAGIDPGIRRARPGSGCLLNVHVDTLMGGILDATTMAAEVLADLMFMENPSFHGEALQVTRCCAIVAPNLPRLLRVSHVEVMLWVDGGTDRVIANTDGPAIVASLDTLSTLAHFTLGQTRARTQRDLPCTRCKAKTVGRWAGSDDFDCTSCGSRFVEDDLDRQMKILLELAKKGLIQP